MSLSKEQSDELIDFRKKHQGDNGSVNLERMLDLMSLISILSTFSL